MISAYSQFLSYVTAFSKVNYVSMSANALGSQRCTEILTCAHHVKVGIHGKRMHGHNVGSPFRYSVQYSMKDVIFLRRDIMSRTLRGCNIVMRHLVNSNKLLTTFSLLDDQTVPHANSSPVS